MKNKSGLYQEDFIKLVPYYSDLRRRKKMKQILLAVSIVLCACSLVSAGIFREAVTRIHVIVNADDAPIEILEFRRYYPDEDENHISSEVEYKNRTDRDIEALAITIIYYNLFNNKEAGVKGISTKLLKAQKVDR